MKQILCYGDSNTWGAIPGSLQRYPEDVRWTGVAARQLGDNYRIHEDGINGRRTVWDDPKNLCRNGLLSLSYALYRTKPLDLVVLMLGTNDLNHTDAKGYGRGLYVLADRILHAESVCPGTSRIFTGDPKLLLVSPIEMAPFMTAYEESKKLARETEAVSEIMGIPWINAATYARPSVIDGCHMEAADHRALGIAVAQVIQAIF